jgi:hypothetical protein
LDDELRREWSTVGGTLGPRWAETLAVAASVGVDPVAILRADPLLRGVLLDVAERGIHVASERDTALARRIINSLAESLKKR